MANRLQRLAETGELTDVQRTTLSVDVLGRYVCNSLQEALDTTDTNGRSDARPFDIIVIGGGTFGASVSTATSSPRTAAWAFNPGCKAGRSKQVRKTGLQKIRCLIGSNI